MGMTTHNFLDINDVQDAEGKNRPEFPLRGNGAIRPHGRYMARREDGRLLLEITYRDGIADGPYLEYWSNGKVACTGQFRHGTQDGLWQFFREDGSLMETIRFLLGKESR